MGKVKETILDDNQIEMGAEEAQEPGSTALITIRQLPVIQQNLIAVKSKWEKMAEEAESMVPSEDSVQDLKNMKAAINAEFKELDEQRKATKKAYAAPWEAVEATYKECVTEPKDRAIASLQKQIDDFESKLVEKTRKVLEDYCYELLALERIDFLTFDKAMDLAGIKRISLTDAKKRDPRALKDALASAITRVATGMAQIQQMEDSAEIMVEFKKSFDAGSAAAIVYQRKRQKAEAEAELQRRKEEDARRAEAVAAVEAAAPMPIQAPEEVDDPEKTPTRSVVHGTPMNKKMHFTIYFETVEQYKAVLPALQILKEALKKEGVRYGN